MYHPLTFHVALRRLLGYIALAIVSFAVYKSVWAARADALAQTGNIEAHIRAIRLAPGNARYWVALADLKDAEYSNAQDSEADHALDRARELNPYDSSIWIQSGLRAESHGEAARAEKFLLHAELLSRQCEPQITLANFYYRSGDQSHFWPRVKRALACTPVDRKPLFDLCWNTTNDVPFILREAIPDVPAVGRDFLEYLLRHNHLDAAEAASIPVETSVGPADRELLLRYVSRMVDAGRWDAALAAWNALSEGKILPHEPLNRERGPWLTNGMFAASPLNAGFDWNTPKVDGVSIAWRPSQQGLRIDFSGDQAEECEILKQFIPVRPLQSYVLTAAYRLPENASGTGLSVRLTDADKGTEIAAAGLDGDSVRLSFKTPARASALRLSLWYRRMPGFTRFEGSIIINAFHLEAQR